MTIPAQKPNLGTPPQEYDPAFLRTMIRQLDAFFNLLNSPGLINASTLNLSSVPGHSTTLLRTGDVFVVDGFLKLYPSSGDSVGSGGGGSGNAILTGPGAPSNSDGADGDVYFKTSSPIAFYGPKSGGVWPAGTVLEGEDGQDGQDGNNASANTIISGTIPPTAGVGNNGDFYIDTAAKMMYGPKASGAWPAGFSLVGPKGDDGEDGTGGGTGTGGWLGGCAVYCASYTNVVAANQLVGPFIWDTRLYDTGYFSDGTPTRLTVPAGVTKVRVSVQTAIQGFFGYNGVNGKIRLVVYKNGSPDYRGMAEECYNLSSIDLMNIRTLRAQSDVLVVQPGDYFEFFFSTDANVVQHSMNTQTTFTIETIDKTS